MKLQHTAAMPKEGRPPEALFDDGSIYVDEDRAELTAAEKRRQAWDTKALAWDLMRPSDDEHGSDSDRNHRRFRSYTAL